MTIPADSLVRIVPSVLGAGGSAINLTGLFLSTSSRVPIGTVGSFSNGAAVTSYFGAGSPEDLAANGATNRGSGYFGGFTNSTKKPSTMLFAQYNQLPAGAYLRGGNVSALTLAQLQAITGTLLVTVDGYVRNASALNLSAATSFSSAAALIQTALNAGGANPVVATMTASIAAGAGASFTASIAGQLMTVSAMTSGTITIGGILAGGGVLANTAITGQVSGTPGGVGVYAVNQSQTVVSSALTETWGLMTVTAVLTGTFAVGQTLSGSGVTVNTLITALGTGTGGTGTYIVNLTQTAASTTISASGTGITATFDSVSGGFLLTSGIVGPASTIGFATGTTSTALKLTSATGAVTSQGAAAAVPAALMDSLLVVNSNWATFTTLFDPDVSGSAVKQAFAAWKNGKNNRFGYVAWDLDQSPTTTLPATNSLGFLLAASGDSGTFLLDGETTAGWDANLGPATAAFVMGAAASIDFSARNGRTAFAYRRQDGLLATVVDPIPASNLGGDPQTPNTLGNGYNFYGAYAQASSNFLWLQRGQVTGQFHWFDSYVNQIWLNSAMQNALLIYQRDALSTPYGPTGNSAIETALAAPIAAGLNFGAFGPGTLSASQAAAVDASAGVKISGTLQSIGYYLQILPADPATRSARTPPPMKFWYIDNGSVQAINLSSIALQ